jgi:heptosyltransferase-1
VSRAGSGPDRLLVVRLSALGDVIHTIPAVVALREALPSTEFAWLVERPYAELVERVAGVRPIPVSLKRWWRERRTSRREMLAAVRAMRAFAARETSVDFQGLVKSASLAALSGARERFGFDAETIREKPALIFTNRRVHPDGTHVIELNRELARGVAPFADLPDVDFTTFSAEETPVLSRMKRRIVLLPGAGKPNKLWPVERLRLLAEECGDEALAVWGPGEEELALQIGCETAPPTSLRELSFILQHARLVIGSDTGPLHLAAALHTPVIGLFGPTNPQRNGPWGQLEHCISTFDGDRTMTSISVADVIAKKRAILGE